MEMALFLIGLGAFSIAAALWGTDSTDSVYSAEWERRRRWPGLVGR